MKTSLPGLVVALASSLLLGCPPADTTPGGSGPGAMAAGGDQGPPPTRRASEPGAPTETPARPRDEPVVARTPQLLDDGCVCEEVMEDGGWCPACQKGYANGEPVSCQTCSVAAGDETGGWCETCQKGYVHRSEVTCKTCVLAATGDAGWCIRHKVGYLEGEKTKCQACASEGARCEACAN